MASLRDICDALFRGDICWYADYDCHVSVLLFQGHSYAMFAKNNILHVFDEDRNHLGMYDPTRMEWCCTSLKQFTKHYSEGESYIQWLFWMEQQQPGFIESRYQGKYCCFNLYPLKIAVALEKVPIAFYLPELSGFYSVKLPNSLYKNPDCQTYLAQHISPMHYHKIKATGFQRLLSNRCQLNNNLLLSHFVYIGAKSCRHTFIICLPAELESMYDILFGDCVLPSLTREVITQIPELCKYSSLLPASPPLA